MPVGNKRGKKRVKKQEDGKKLFFLFMAGEKNSAEGGEYVLVRASPCDRSPVTALSTQITLGFIIVPALLSIPSVRVHIFQSLL